MAKIKTPTSPKLTVRQAQWLWAATVAAFLPVVGELPPWLGSIAALVLAWRALLFLRHATLPPRWLLAPLVLAGSMVIAIYYHTLMGREPGVAMLMLLVAMKTLELRTRRDGFALV